MVREYKANLDCIKIVAATGIVFHHYQQVASVRFGGWIEFYGGNFTFGYLVELFFIISGYLTAYTFRDDSKFVLWFSGKLKRYYPYALIATLSCLIMAPVYFSVTNKSLLDLNYDISHIITSLTLLHTGYVKEFSPAINNPTWYLCVLTLCYLLFWLYKKFESKSRLLTRFGFGAVALIMMFAYYAIMNGHRDIPFLRLSNVRGYGSFFVGCFLCKLYSTLKKRDLIIADVLLWLLSGVGFWRLGLSSWYVLTYAFFPAIVITALLLPQNRSSFIKKAGEISFEVYLWHVFLMTVFITFFAATGYTIRHTYGTMIIFTTIAWIWATGIHFCVDRPLSRMLKRKE